jgi:ribosomal protein S18 acetylase RimI-like enzyme
MDLERTVEITFYVVEIFALPFAIGVFIYEQRRERQNEEEELFQRLSDEYRDFLKLVLDNPDLHLLRREAAKTDWSEEQRERRLAIFGILVSLFENAYLVVYDDADDSKGRRLWQSWEDYMREWLRRSDFRDALPVLLEGEDEAFTAYIQALARHEAARGGS